MGKNETVILCFSKNRALQLDLCLNSLYENLQDGLDSVDFKVIYKADGLHENSYKTIKREHGHIVDFIKEEIFNEDVLNVLRDYKFVLFSVDDSIYCRSFSVEKIVSELKRDNKLIGCSLRLGKNTWYCYPYEAYQRVPPMEKVTDRLYKYSWYSTNYDFRYVLEISSSIYRVADFWDILYHNYFSCPNQLEALLDYCRQHFVNKYPEILCYETSVCFQSPNNKVQTVAFLNRAGTQFIYSPENLLMEYENGRRIDPNRFKGMMSNACHVEVELF